VRYGSVCSGVEAATVAWEPLGWEPAWFCEFDKFPSAVLEHHYPDVPNLNDMTKILENEVFNDRSIDLLVGGTPCQSFSIAGLRKGLGDERGVDMDQIANGNYSIDRLGPRRLTPVECERLQGFQDNYTQIPYRGKDAAQCPDGPRYKTMGNSMAVPCMRWIGGRIEFVHQEIIRNIYET